MSTITLTSKQRRFLKAKGHALKAVVIIGAERCTPGVIAHIDDALEQHELLKVRLTDADRAEVLQAAAALTEGTGCVVAQRIGGTLVLYRKRREGKPTIHLPR
jgi:RNA-binding protein